MPLTLDQTYFVILNIRFCDLKLDTNLRYYKIDFVISQIHITNSIYLHKNDPDLDITKSNMWYHNIDIMEFLILQNRFGIFSSPEPKSHKVSL